MARWSYFLLITLILGALEVNAQADEEDEGFSVPEETPEDAETEDTFILTKDICMDGHESSFMSKQCCEDFVESDEHATLCASKIRNTTNLSEQVLETTKYTECVFNRWNYIKDSQHLNFDQIKADAAKLGDPFKEKFMVDMYKICGRQATGDMKTLSERPEYKTLSRHKPYFLLVNMCAQSYTATHQCPYFRYGSLQDDVDEKCDDYTQKCEKLLKE